jgi:hypothetical protein
MSSSLFHGRRVLWMPPFACADALVVYNEVLDEYGLPVHDGGPSYVLISHCPWCGKSLPEGQRDRWFDETEALGLADDASLPARYLTRAWRMES